MVENLDTSCDFVLLAIFWMTLRNKVTVKLIFKIFKIYTCGWKLKYIMSLCITCQFLDDLEQLGQGQIDLQNFQYAICQQLGPLKIHLWLKTWIAQSPAGRASIAC